MDLEESFSNLSLVESPVKSPRRKNPAIDLFNAARPTSKEEKPKLAVMLSPDSYKHKFRRDWESSSFKKSVVERPERLNACALGIGAANSKVALEIRTVELARDLRQSEAAKLVHGEEYILQLYKLCAEARQKQKNQQVEVPDTWSSGDMYLATESIQALESVVGAIEEALQLVFTTHTRVFTCVRPPGHHCHKDVASGFCVINNAHVAIQHAKIKHGVTHAVIFDFDLHHGDGTQDLCWGRDMPLGYFSLHDIHSFPTEKDYAEPIDIMKASACVDAHDMHLWNVHLEPFENAAAFDDLYEQKYSELFLQAVKFLRKHIGLGKPLIVISAGFDGSEYEMKSMQRHGVSVPTSFFNRFTRDCVALADTFCGGRVLSLLEGGYSTQALATGTFSHLVGMAGHDWQTEWVTPDIALKFEKGSHKTWKNDGDWPAEAIQSGRQLFKLRPQERAPSPIRTRRRVRE